MWSCDCISKSQFSPHHKFCAQLLSGDFIACSTGYFARLKCADMSELSSTVSLPSRIASLVHAHFDALPTRSKPTIFPDGSREWIPMTGIVAVKGMYRSLEHKTGFSNNRFFVIYR